MKIVLYILIAVIAVTSTASGLLMVSDPQGELLGLSPTLLEGTPFKDYKMPGFLLALIVGGMCLIAAYAIVTQSARRYSWTMACGLVTVGWLVFQMMMITAIHWTHFLLFGAGVLIILISYQLKGKWAV